MKKEYAEFNQIISSHIEHLLDYEDIESSCAVSSQLLGSFFHEQGWKIIYGSYGHHHFFHSWIETPAGILDPTRFQFLTNKREIDYYKNSECTHYYDYILNVQDSWLFDKADPCYHKIAEMSPLFKRTEEDYKDFLMKVIYLDSYKRFNWRHTRLKGETIHFLEYLKSINKRIGKKHFFRFAVCKL